MKTIPAFVAEYKNELNKTYPTMRTWLLQDFEKIEERFPNSLIKKGIRIYILNSKNVLSFYGIYEDEKK